MNFGELKAEIRGSLWPDGEAENLIAPHDKKFIEALVDLQSAIPCLRFGNLDVYPHCSTYFNCGMTVLPAPRGQVTAIYTIGKQVSTDGSVSDGTEVASLDLPESENQLLILEDGGLVIPDPTVADIGIIPDDGLYTVTVTQKNSKSSLYAVNSPQYFRTEIIYTDSDGNQKTIQPAALIHMNVSSNSGSMIITAKAGSTISTRVSSFNSPQIDGGMEVIISVVKGSQFNNDDWCSKVFYDRVDYSQLERYGRLCARQTGGLRAVGDALVANLFGFGRWRAKNSYPAPDDAGYQLLPALPGGFHYPQKSTDAGGRSRRGVFAVHHGRIYIAPWIESTESVVIEWNGRKTDWADTDEVSDDPKFKKAVTEYVGREHFTYYESDDTKKADFIKNYALTVRELISDCREITRTPEVSEAGISASAAAGVGSLSSGGIGSATFYNEKQSYTATCPAGQSGSSVTSTIAANTIASSFSVADANARALAAATADAQSKLQCSDTSGLFLNVEQTFTASCPGANGSTPAATGNQATVTIEAGAYQSTVSQELADAAALAAATERANAQLTCTFYNAPQTANATCPAGTTGSQQTATVGAGQFTASTQAEADSLAQAEAQRQAQSALSCSASTILIGNTEQSVTRQDSMFLAGCSQSWNYNIVATVYVNTYVSQATTATQAAIQTQLNNQALSAASAKANALYTQQLNQFIALNCGHNILGAGGVL